MGFGVRGLGFGFRSFGFRVSAFEFRVQGFGFRVQASGFRGSGLTSAWYPEPPPLPPQTGFSVQLSGFRVLASGFRLQGFRSGVQATRILPVSIKTKSLAGVGVRVYVSVISGIWPAATTDSAIATPVGADGCPGTAGLTAAAVKSPSPTWLGV